MQARENATLGDLRQSPKKFVVVCKKCFMKHEGQVVKQVSKPKRIFERLALSKPITQKKSQHYGIGSHLYSTL
jgi:hypothetical protein